MKKIAVLASGEAAGALALASLFNEGNRIRVVMALSDRESAAVLPAMRDIGVDTFFIPRDKWSSSPDEIEALLLQHEIDLVVVDGFGQLLPASVCDAFKGRIFSVFPSLTPADSAGVVSILDVQRKVIGDGDALAGAVVCRADGPDATGIILMKGECEAGSDAEALAARVADIQRDILPRAVAAHFREISSPAPPSLEQQWAEVLGVEYRQPQAGATPPPVPGIPSVPQSPDSLQSSQSLQSPQSPRNTQGISQPEQPPMPPSYLVWSVLSTVVCCFIPGIIAIIFSSQVASKYFAKDYEGAARASRNAEIWIIVSFVLGLISTSLYLPLMLLS